MMNNLFIKNKNARKKLKNNRTKKLAFTFMPFLSAFALYSNSAQATCEFASGASQLAWFINVGNVTVQRDAPVGTIIYQRDLNSAQIGKTILSCTGTFTPQLYIMRMGSAVTVPGQNYVYSTNLPGVGVKVTSYNGNPFTVPQNSWDFVAPYILPNVYKFYLIKTGDISGGTLWTGRLFEWTTNKTSGGTLTVGYGNFSGGTVNTVACSVTNTSIVVPMGNVSRNTFSSVGHQSDPVPFFVGLNCDSGTRVNITLDATADSSGTPGVVALTSAGSAGVASGVGVQLTYSGTPVTFGTPIPIVTSTGGALNIPLIARYYQTLTKVTAGIANAQATFTMTYN